MPQFEVTIHRTTEWTATVIIEAPDKDEAADRVKEEIQRKLDGGKDEIDWELDAEIVDIESVDKV